MDAPAQALLYPGLLASLFQDRDKAALGPLRTILATQDCAESIWLRDYLHSLLFRVISGAQSPQTLGMYSGKRGSGGGRGGPAGQQGKAEATICLRQLSSPEGKGSPSNLPLGRKTPSGTPQLLGG